MKRYKFEKKGLVTRLADTPKRKNATVKLFSTKPREGWIIIAESTQGKRTVKRRLLLSTPAMCAVLNMFCNLTIKLGGAK